MASDQKVTESRWCGIHPDRKAVEHCGECGRAACLACAVPVRGRVLCTECARRVVGEPAPPPAPARGPASRILDVGAASLLGVAFLGTLLPWQRFGTLTGAFSAWRLSNPWPFLSSVLILIATLGAAAVLLRWPPLLRYSAPAYAVAAAMAAAAVGVALLRAPGFTSHTPAPYVVLIGAVGAAAVGAVRLRRSPQP
ncbi:MAG: hypothetical protein ACRDIX_05175 [Actinomycetota bacterium]